mmetsp:Transcript_35826/g.112079  ORF Transcript_35826/g.112079 Transcript_35826/m.112079 type:complete len:474 (-) Transcript_35826:100-1521(-)
MALLKEANIRHDFENHDYEGFSTSSHPLQALNGSGGPPSKAVLSALRTLQDKIKMLEDDRQQLQTRLKESEEAREREDQQHRLLERQLQLQLQESVKTLNIRHETEVDSIKKHNKQIVQELQDSVQNMNTRLSEVKDENYHLQSKLQAVRQDLGHKDDELQRLKHSLADLEAADVALRKVNEKLERKLKDDEDITTQLTEKLLRLEQECSMLKTSKKQSEERVNSLLAQFERLETDYEGIRTENLTLRDQVKTAQSRITVQDDEISSIAADKTAILSEKRQLESSLQNVLLINEQLLSKVCEASLGDFSAQHKSILQEEMSGGNSTRIPASQGSSLAAPKRVRRKKSPASAVATASSRVRQSLEEDVKYRPKTANMQAKRSPTERQKGGQVSKISDFMQTQIPKDEVKILEEEILEEILHLRRQYKDICAQVQGTEESQFDAQQLNVALKSVIDKLEKKGKQIQLIHRLNATA